MKLDWAMVSQNSHQKNKQERQNRYIKLCQNLELLHFKVYYGKSEDSPPKEDILQTIYLMKNLRLHI